ncbi:MAG: hypothetical protein PHY47_19400 [Lachnospiraceae bacterium]|nr:hypothetical protein [Lachnospiraceae bacterium]
MLKEFMEGYKGYRIVKSTGMLNQKNSHIVVMPCEDGEYNRKLLDIYLSGNCNNRICVMSTEKGNPCIDLQRQGVKKQVKLSSADMNKLVKYYVLDGWNTNMLLLSLDIPFGRFGSRWLKKVDLEHLVRFFFDNDEVT